MDIHVNAEIMEGGRSQESDIPSVMAIQTEPVGPKSDNDNNCYENESTSCANAEVKTNDEISDNSQKEKSQPSQRNTESPEPSCSICLGKMENKSFTNSCFHQFCFSCLLEWSKVKPECPLCKQPFKSIVHNVRSMEDYDQYHLRSDNLSRLENPDGRRFRYRSTLTTERRRELAMGRFLMSHHLPTRSRPLLTTSDYRRHVYESGLWVRVQPTTRSTRYREASPEFYTQNPACTHRLIPWLNRELNALEFGHQVAFLMELILSLITRFHIQSPEFRELVQPYFLGNTNHFIHEFFSFARSPHDMVDYDRRVSYGESLTQLVEDAGSDSDVIVLSPDRSSRPRWSQRALQTSPFTISSTERARNTVLNRARDFLETVSLFGTLPSDPRPSTSTLGSPEPGPSGLQHVGISENRHVNRLRSVITVPTPRVQGVKPELTVMDVDDDDDCIFLGYEEPPLHRKPLDVIILSDSDDDAIMEVPVPEVVEREPLSTVDTAHHQPGTSAESHKNNRTDNDSDESSSTTCHTSRSLSPIHSKKSSKRNKRMKSRHSHNSTRSKTSPSSSSSHSHHHHHCDKHKHKKHSSKSSAHSKYSNKHEEESSDRKRVHHKSSKKKHSHKHKNSKSCDHKSS